MIVKDAFTLNLFSNLLDYLKKLFIYTYSRTNKNYLLRNFLIYNHSSFNILIKQNINNTLEVKNIKMTIILSNLNLLKAILKLTSNKYKSMLMLFKKINKISNLFKTIYLKIINKIHSSFKTMCLKIINKIHSSFQKMCLKIISYIL